MGADAPLEVSVSGFSVNGECRLVVLTSLLRLSLLEGDDPQVSQDDSLETPVAHLAVDVEGFLVGLARLLQAALVAVEPAQACQGEGFTRLIPLLPKDGQDILIGLSRVCHPFRVSKVDQCRRGRCFGTCVAGRSVKITCGGVVLLCLLGLAALALRRGERSKNTPRATRGP